MVGHEIGMLVSITLFKKTVLMVGISFKWTYLQSTELPGEADWAGVVACDWEWGIRGVCRNLVTSLTEYSGAALQIAEKLSCRNKNSTWFSRRYSQ